MPQTGPPSELHYVYQDNLHFFLDDTIYHKSDDRFQPHSAAAYCLANVTDNVCRLAQIMRHVTEICRLLGKNGGKINKYQQTNKNFTENNQILCDCYCALTEFFILLGVGMQQYILYNTTCEISNLNENFDGNVDTNK